MRVAVPGAHNARNAAVAAVAALAAGAPVDAAARALARFAGVARRFEFRGEPAGVTFVDDYAHLPTEVARRARGGPGRRLGAGRGRLPAAPLQPDRRAGAAFADAFADADVVVVTDVYAPGSRRVPGVSGRLVADAVAGAAPGSPTSPTWPGAPSCGRASAGAAAPGRPVPDPRAPATSRRWPDELIAATA